MAEFYNVSYRAKHSRPNIVSKDNIIRLNSIGKIVDSAATIISPGLGGALYAVMGIQFFVLLNGIALILYCNSYKHEN